MPVFNPFQPWTYQENRPRQPKPATTEEVKPPTARPSPPPPTAGGGVIIEHTPGGVVGHGGVHVPPTTTPTSTGGSKPPTPPPGGAGGTKTPTTGGSTPGTSTAIQSTALSMAQGVVSDYKSHGVAYGPGINSAESFLAYMNALKQSNPALYNQLMQNPTIRQAMQYAQAYINYANAFVNWHLNPNPTMTTQQFAVTTANNLMTQINQNMQSGNYSQALQYAQMLKTLAQQYGLPINTQSLNTLINELSILSRLPNPPSTSGPRLDPHMLSALAREDPGFYNLVLMTNYQNSYRQWSAYANQLNQLANQAQSMGLTDLANRLRAQASTANQVAQGYLTQFILSAPPVQQFVSSYNQLVSLLNNQPNPQTDPQGWVQWYNKVRALTTQTINAYDQAKIYLVQGKDLPQIQQLIEAGGYVTQLNQQLGALPMLNVTPSALAQPGGLGMAFMGGALTQSLAQLPPGTRVTQTQATTTQNLNPIERAGYEVGRYLSEFSQWWVNTNPLYAALLSQLPPGQRRQVENALAMSSNPAAGLGFGLGLFAVPISQLASWAANAGGLPPIVTEIVGAPAEFYSGLNLGIAQSGQGFKAPSGPIGFVWQTLTGSEYVTPASIGSLVSFALPIAALRSADIAELLMRIDPTMLMMSGLGRGLIRTGAWLETAGPSLAEELAPIAESGRLGSSIYRLGEFLGDVAGLAGRGLRVVGSALTPVMVEEEPIVEFERVGEGVFRPTLELQPARVRVAPIVTGISEEVPGLGTIRIVPVASEVVGGLTSAGEVAGVEGVTTPFVRALVEELPPEQAAEVLREVRYMIGYPGRLPIEAGFLVGVNPLYEEAQQDVFDVVNRLWRLARASRLAEQVMENTESPLLARLTYELTQNIPVTALESARFGNFMRDVEEAAITSKDFSEFMGRLAQIARRYGLEAPPSNVASELYSELMGSLRTMATLESQGLVRPGAQAIRFIASEMPGQPYLLEYGPARAFGLGETGELVSVLEGTENLPRVGYAVTPSGRLLTTITEEEAELPPALRAGEEALGGAGAGARAGAEAGTELQQLERLGLTEEQAEALLRQAESMGTRFAPIGGAELGALVRALEEARQSQQPIATGGGSQVSITIQRPTTQTPQLPTTAQARAGGGGGIGVGGGGGGGGESELEEYWTWVIPPERRGFVAVSPPYVPIQTVQTTKTTPYVITPPTTYNPPTTSTYTEAPPVTVTQTPTIETPVPPTAVPTIPPFLIPLLWFPSWMPQQYPMTGELARPGTMREILVL